jgi:hypothetical protein
MTTYHLTNSISTFLSPQTAKSRAMANIKTPQDSKSADISPNSGATDHPTLQVVQKKRRKNLWGHYVDETAEEKAQRRRVTDETTNKATRASSSYTVNEEYLSDETMEEAKDTINKEMLEANTESAKAVTEAREDQMHKKREEKLRHVEREETSEPSFSEEAAVGGTGL